MVREQHHSITGQSEWTVFTVSERHNTVIKSQDLTSSFFYSQSTSAPFFSPVWEARVLAWEAGKVPVIYGSFAGLTASHLKLVEPEVTNAASSSLLLTVWANPISFIWDLKPPQNETQEFHMEEDLFEHFNV